MIKSIKAILAQDKEKFKVPRKVQDLIPIKNIWPDGIFKVGNKFSKSFRFSDINYLVASHEDKESMFLTYSELLNSLDSGATTKITINNHRLNRSDFEESILMPMKQDGLDEYRKEYNDMLLDKATGANGITQEKYITITVAKKDIEEARAYFARIGADLTAHFANLGSKCVPLNAVERLRILHDFYRPGDEAAFSFDMNRKARLGHDFRDYICPDSIERAADHIKLGEKYARVLFLKDYASYIKDSMFSELTELNRNLMLSIDVIPIPTDEAVREVERLLLGVETNITGWQRRQNQNNNFSAVVPYDMELQRKESKEFLDDLTTRDQRMMFAVVTMVITADTKEQLDLDTETVLSTARKHMCQMATLKYQQTDGLNTVLPIGTRKIKQKRSDTMKYLPTILKQEAQKLEPFFKFWKATEIFDLKARARNYLVHEVITNGSGLFVKPYDSEHMKMRKHFGAALFAVDVSEVERKNPYQEFEALVRRDGWNKIYSLHRLPLPGNQEKADILRNETKLYLNQACRKDKTAIPSDWCIYCVHRENCMESFLRSEVGMSSSRNEPCINRSVRANAPVKNTLPPVCEQEIIDVEAVPAEPIIPATASIIDTAPAVETPIVETPVVDVPAVDAPASEVAFVKSPAAEVPTHVDTPKSPELSIFEQMFRQIQEMVEGNRQEIQSLKGELAARQSRREDTTRIQARLEDEEHRSQELLDKLAETESRLATSEAQVKKQRELEFTESELAELRKYSTIIVFDTCSIMNCPNLLDGVNDGELVVVPKDVNNELEHHKTRFGADDRKFKAQKAITAIFNYKRRFPLTYADGLPSLVPEAYRAKADEKEQNDNKILAVALRYKIYTDIPVLFITDDRSLSNKASGEGLDVWTSKDFLAPPETSFDDESPTVPGTPAPIPELEAQIAGATAAETPALESSEEERLDAEAAETKRQAKAKEEYLAQKISTKLLHLEASQISLLQNNGIKTIADFMAQTENSFASMKVKKGIPFTARFLKEQETIRCKLENL